MTSFSLPAKKNPDQFGSRAALPDGALRFCGRFLFTDQRPEMVECTLPGFSMSAGGRSDLHQNRKGVSRRTHLEASPRVRIGLVEFAAPRYASMQKSSRRWSKLFPAFLDAAFGPSGSPSSGRPGSYKASRHQQKAVRTRQVLRADGHERVDVSRRVRPAPPSHVRAASAASRMSVDIPCPGRDGQSPPMPR